MYVNRPDFRESLYWETLEASDPVKRAIHMKPFSSIEFHKNRPLFNMIREIAICVFENSRRYLNGLTPHKRFGRGVPKAVDVVTEILKMVEEVWNVKLKGTKLKFNTNCLKEELYNFIDDPERDVAALLANTEKDVPQLQLYCSKNSIKANFQEIVDIVKSFRQLSVLMCFDLFFFLVNADPKTARIVMHSYKMLKPLKTRLVYESNVLSSFGMVLFPSELHEDILRRNETIPMWTAIPCEEEEHLVDSVLDYSLIELLPKKARDFLTKWLVGVRDRMRHRLRSGENLREAARMFPEATPVHLRTDNSRVTAFIRKVVGEVMNSEELPIVGKQWQDLIEKVINCESLLKSMSSNIVKSFFPSARSSLSAQFSTSRRQKNLLSHTIVQLFRFVLIFTAHTIRHFFHHLENYQLMYDGEIEEEVKQFDEDELKTPMTSQLGNRCRERSSGNQELAESANASLISTSHSKHRNDFVDDVPKKRRKAGTGHDEPITASSRNTVENVPQSLIAAPVTTAPPDAREGSSPGNCLPALRSTSEAAAPAVIVKREVSLDTSNALLLAAATTPVMAPVPASPPVPSQAPALIPILAPAPPPLPAPTRHTLCNILLEMFQEQKRKIDQMGAIVIAIQRMEE